MRHPGYLNAIINGKCPRCRKGYLFKRPFWDLMGYAKTHSHCTHCGIKYEVEPGFFWGAMYVSYAINSAIFIASYVALVILVGNPSMELTLIVVLSVVLGTQPLIFRYSRILMLHWFSQISFIKAYYYGPPRPPEDFDSTGEKKEAAFEIR
jgi:uncharacterized protein (DUF983 family)